MRFLFAILMASALQVSSASAALVTFMADLAGPSSPATGSALLTLDTSANTYSVSMVVMGLDPNNLRNVGSMSPVHIHFLGSGGTGPVLNDLGSFATRQDFGNFGFSYSGSNIAVNQATEDALLAGTTYINVHTNAFPGGEIRGNLVAVSAIPEPSSVALATVAALGFGVYQVRRRRRSSRIG